jgi:hypothetical protein
MANPAGSASLTPQRANEATLSSVRVISESLADPGSLAVASDGSIWLSYYDTSSGDNIVQRFATPTSSPQNKSEGMERIWQMVPDAAGKVYLLEANNSAVTRIQVGSPSFGFSGISPLKNSSFSNALVTAIAPDGKVLYLMNAYGWIIKAPLSGSPTAVGSYPGGVGNNDQVLLLPDGTLIATVFNNLSNPYRYVVYHVSKTGSIMSHFAVPTSAPGSDIAADVDGTIYIANNETGVITKSSPNGSDKARFATDALGVSAIAMGANGHLYAIDSDGVVEFK